MASHIRTRGRMIKNSTCTGGVLALLLVMSTVTYNNQAVAQSEPEEWMSEDLGRVDTKDACIARAEEVAEKITERHDGHYDRDQESIEIYDVTEDNFDFVIRCLPWDNGDPTADYMGTITGKNETDREHILRELIREFERAWDRLGYVG